MKKYEIISITHSGRKGLRGTPVDEIRYDGLVGSIVVCKDLEGEAESIKNKPFHFDFASRNEPYEYRFWDTTLVLGLYINKNWNYVLETVNTLYELKPLDDNV